METVREGDRLQSWGPADPAAAHSRPAPLAPVPATASSPQLQALLGDSLVVGGGPPRQTHQGGGVAGILEL